MTALSGSEIRSSAHHWYALQVWVRKENLVANHLAGLGFECFLPKYKSVRQWSDRKKEVEQPLFPGYLFCRFNYNERRPVAVTPGVLQVVGNGRQGLPVDEQEIEAIQLAVNSGIQAQPWALLDIASVGDSPNDEFEYTKGATGFGARALLHWLEMREPLAGVAG